MKRLVWLFLAAFCTALAQVQPLELPAMKHSACSCCEQSGACGMRDCATATVQANPYSAFERENATGSTTAQPAKNADRFASYFLTFSAPALLSVRVSPVSPATTANGPLFQAHCSFLI